MLLQIDTKKESVIILEDVDDNSEPYEISDYNDVRLGIEFAKYNIMIPGLDNRKTRIKTLEDSGNILVRIPGSFLRIISELSEIILSAEETYKRRKRVSPFEDGSLISVNEDALSIVKTQF